MYENGGGSGNGDGGSDAGAARPFSYLLELRDDGEDEDGGFGFVLPKEQIRVSGRETMAGVRRMLEGLSGRMYGG